MAPAMIETDCLRARLKLWLLRTPAEVKFPPSQIPRTDYISAMPPSFHVFVLIAAAVSLPLAGRAADLPPPAARTVDFVKDIKPLFEAACVKCHAKGKDKGGFSLETREAFLKGGDTGAGGGRRARARRARSWNWSRARSGRASCRRRARSGRRSRSGCCARGSIRARRGRPDITFAKPPPQNLHPRTVALRRAAERASDRQSARAAISRSTASRSAAPVDDRIFARRVYLDLIGLLPTPEQLDAFLADTAPDKRAQLVRTLLADKRNYADHWLTFWNDLLRNDYKGTGFIDGGRKQITGWLYTALDREQALRPLRRASSSIRRARARASAAASSGAATSTPRCCRRCRRRRTSRRSSSA